MKKCFYFDGFEIASEKSDVVKKEAQSDFQAKVKDNMQ